MNELALFAGAGGGILGSHLMGLRTICAVERDAYAAQVLAQRQNDGILPAFPIWSDITTFDGKPWAGIVDVVSGGFPCQDISSAGKGTGIDGERSGLWSEMARIIGEVRPREVWVENSPMLVSRGLTRVISDLAQMGYDAHWTRFSASNFGAPHIRDRVWIVGYTSSERLEKEWLSWGLDAKKPDFGGDGSYISNSKSERWEQAREGKFSSSERISGSGKERSRWWGIEPRLGRVANGVAYRVDRLKAIGNGQVPIVAKSAFEFLRGN
ncbi:DNA cytosine methyltransferase [Acinetobacter sp. NIPH 298]|uniref:DNA cytosine methyltransferase n=1 Tax=Acinetobacter sp. NIPH 298 TaxID=1217692 RepID=UPI000551BA7E|nr:DNA cytosine methyltransferase [Acinetobacter sp. NIPH 298]